MADMLTRSLGIQTVSANSSGNTVTVRDTAARLALANRLLNVNDREPAEGVQEVDTHEVNCPKSEQPGLSFESQINVAPPEFEITDIFQVSGIGDKLSSRAVTLPVTIFRLFKEGCGRARPGQPADQNRQ